MKEIFSPMETKILRVLGRRKMMIGEITKKMYDHKKGPIGANNGVGTAIRRINIKCDYHKLPWFLNGSGVGRGGKEVWKDKR